jgi:hypothetical protein
VGLATPSPPRAEAHERVELYLYSASWALRVCYRVNFTFTINYTLFIHDLQLYGFENHNLIFVKCYCKGNWPILRHIAEQYKKRTDT